MFITTKLRHRAASFALAATIGLTFFKFVVAYLSGSVGVMSEGVHSLLDLISASVAFFTVREAGKPADEDHPFGHGKFETISSLLEAVLLTAAALLITGEGIHHLKYPHAVHYHGLAIGTILVSMIVSYFMYKHNGSAATETESPALHVNALHFLSDVVAGAGVLAGLVLLKLTGWQIVDPIMAFGVAGYIMLISIAQVKKALKELTDSQLPESEITQIKDVLGSFADRMIEAHDLRTRKSGATRHIDFHLVVCGHLSVDQSHSVCDDMEGKLLALFPGASVNIHVEPCERKQTGCEKTCDIFQKAKHS